jgi:uncharacterized protein
MTLDIPTLIDAAGGEIVGKVRLQKLVYLLHQLGIESDLPFAYHHFGPYSEELADRVEDDIVFGRITAEERRRSDGVPYVIYKSLDRNGDRITNDVLSAPRVRDAIFSMQKRTATLLELAATIHWLAFVEKIKDWRTELVRRKGVKTEQGRADAALDLLKELHLAPA